MKNILKKAAKVMAIIGACLISTIGSAIIGAAIVLAALEQKKKEEVKTKTEVKETKKEERSNETIIYGFSRENLEELRKLGEK